VSLSSAKTLSQKCSASAAACRHGSSIAGMVGAFDGVIIHQ
jgi:hypothetical protein